VWSTTLAGSATRLIRHSRWPDAPLMLFNRDEWAAFVRGVQNHEFDPQ